MPKRGAREGEVLAGKYRLDALLGAGGMGEVYRAENIAIGRAVAIKMLRAEHTGTEEVVARFLREARAANIVRHPNVVDVLDIGQTDDGAPFIVQELLEGQDLAKYARSLGGRLDVRDAIDLLAPVIDAVAFAHERGVIHRDLKPENVFLARMTNGTIVPKLLDFGISRIVSGDEQRMTATGMSIGTPAYMSPEQIRADRVIDARSDVWSIGVILHELLSGSLPFQSEAYSGLFVKIVTEPPVPLDTALPGAPRALTSVVDRCLRANLAERYASATEVARDLRAARQAPSMAEIQLPDESPAAAPARVSQAATAIPVNRVVTAVNAPRSNPPPPAVVPDLEMPVTRARTSVGTQAAPPVHSNRAPRVVVEGGDMTSELVPTSSLELDFTHHQQVHAQRAIGAPPTARAGKAMRDDVPPERNRTANNFLGMSVMWGIVLAITGGISSVAPSGPGWPVATWIGALDRAAPWMAGAIAGVLVVVGVVAFVVGARAQPTSWGLVLSAPGLLAEAVVVAGFAIDGLPRLTGASGLDALERILCPWPAALVLFGVSIFALRRGWSSWASRRPGRSGGAALGIVLAVAALFATVQVVRGAEASTPAATGS